ncbi:MAG: class I SAM-dependent methyltransferase, partial [Gammaproteobacteria bacterium]|nr:class I SAM-dependent methyltransferase [Gammaproteobacteria bacterium]
MGAHAEATGGDPRLVALIRAAIDQAGGAISFADYMDLALFAPELGYYHAGAVQFGSGGDFITAPESSPLFARC